MTDNWEPGWDDGNLAGNWEPGWDENLAGMIREPGWDDGPGSTVARRWLAHHHHPTTGPARPN